MTYLKKPVRLMSMLTVLSLNTAAPLALADHHESVKSTGCKQCHSAENAECGCQEGCSGSGEEGCCCQEACCA